MIATAQTNVAAARFGHCTHLRLSKARNFYYQVSAQATGTGTGTIVGQVTDPWGVVVPKATVTLTNAATGNYNLKRTADELRGFAFPIAIERQQLLLPAGASSCHWGFRERCGRQASRAVVVALGLAVA